MPQKTKKRPNASRRTDLQREHDMIQMLEMHYQRISIKDIAARFKISERQVRLDLAEVHKQLATDQSVSDRKQTQRRILGKLELLEKQLWVAWVRSAMDQETQSKKKVAAGAQQNGQNDGEERMEVSVKTEGQAGSASLACQLRGVLQDQANRLSRRRATAK